jgi:uncharacterized protein YndB with AHSA1/START domain
MACYRTTIDIARPADEVFAYMAAFENVASWDPGVVRSARLDEGPLRVGSRFEVVASFLGAESRFVYTIRQLDAPTRIVLEAETDALRSLDTISLEKTDTGTRLTYDAVLVLKGIRYVADPLLHVAFQWIGARAAAGLEQALASGESRAAA